MAAERIHMDAETTIIVAIATLDRPEGLARALASVAAQALPVNARLSALVVNNNPADEGPRSVAARIREASGLEVEVLDEPARGVANARNRALAAAVGRAEWLAFLDDDEIAPPGWLAALLGAAERHGAEVATGSVKSEFEETPPGWVVSGGFFDRPERPTGTRRPWAFTGSVLMRLTALARLGGSSEWFDPSFDQGEDRDFFTRLARNGAHIVWVAESPPVELVPASRVTPEWLVERMRRIGRSTGRIERRLRGARTVPLLLAKSAVWIVIGLAALLAGLSAGLALRVKGRRWIAYGAGLASGALTPSAG